MSTLAKDPEPTKIIKQLSLTAYFTVADKKDDAAFVHIDVTREPQPLLTKRRGRPLKYEKVVKKVKKEASSILLKSEIIDVASIEDPKMKIEEEKHENKQ